MGSTCRDRPWRALGTLATRVAVVGALVAALGVSGAAPSRAGTPADANFETFSALHYLSSIYALQREAKTTWVVPMTNRSPTASTVLMRAGYYCVTANGAKQGSQPLRSVVVPGDPEPKPDLRGKKPLAFPTFVVTLPRACAPAGNLPIDGWVTISIAGSKVTPVRGLTIRYRMYKPMTAANLAYNMWVIQEYQPYDGPYQAHHTLPQKFRTTFEAKGLTIDDPHYAVWWCSRKGVPNNHQSKASVYNNEWEVFLSRPRTKAQILAERSRLESKYRPYYRCP